MPSTVGTQVVWRCVDWRRATAGGGRGFSLALYSRMSEMEPVMTIAPHSASGATGSRGVRLAWGKGVDSLGSGGR